MLLGNLTTNQIEKRLCFTLTTDERAMLESMRQNKAEHIMPGKWHCFDIPFTMLCGDMDTAKKVHELLRPYSGEMKGQLQISIEKPEA